MIFESILVNLLELGFVDWKVEFCGKLYFWEFVSSEFLG